jgi:hypothetical protein
VTMFDDYRCKGPEDAQDFTSVTMFYGATISFLPAWILVVPTVSHVSECSTIRTAFALPRRDDNGAETSTRLAKKGKTRSRRNLGVVLPHNSKI